MEPQGIEQSTHDGCRRPKDRLVQLAKGDDVAKLVS